jgi:hypothetical protein
MILIGLTLVKMARGYRSVTKFLTAQRRIIRRMDSTESETGPSMETPA